MDKLSKNKVEFDYKDISPLRKFISEKGKITPRRISYISIKKQKDLSNAIKRAGTYLCFPIQVNKNGNYNSRVIQQIR